MSATVLGHRYLPVSRICAYPSGEMRARSSGGNAESVALALRDSMAEVKRVPVNDDGGKEVQVGYAGMLALQCHLALSRNRPV